MKLPVLIAFLLDTSRVYEKEGFDLKDVDVLFAVEGKGYDITHYAAMQDEEGEQDPRLVFALSPLGEEEDEDGNPRQPTHH